MTVTPDIPTGLLLNPGETTLATEQYTTSLTVSNEGRQEVSYEQTILAALPVGYWRLGEPSGTDAADEMGTHDGVYTASPTLGVTGALAGNADTAITLPSGAYVSVADNDDAFDFGATAFSLECWVKRATISLNAAIFARGLGSFYLRFNTSNQIELVREAQAVLGASTGTLTDTTDWHHVAMTRTAGGVTEFYLDGIDIGGFSGGSIVNVALTELRIGQNVTGGAQPLLGSIDEAAIYSYVLTPAQVASHFAIGDTGSAVTFSGQTTLALDPGDALLALYDMQTETPLDPRTTTLLLDG